MIQLDRLKKKILALAEIGMRENGGVTRTALTQEDKEGRDLLVQWMEEAGLSVRIDDFGNIYGTKKGTDPKAPVVLTGSHIDTVPNGGKFDGVLGVLGALEAVESLAEAGEEHLSDIEIVSFTNEEGAVFSPQMLGSGAVTGEFSKEYVYSRKDAEGRHFDEELKRIGYLGEESCRLNNVGSYIELHIEQGPVLEKEGKEIGIVEGISGFSWWNIKINGEADHSGTTPMPMRKDSLVAAAGIIRKLYGWADQQEDGALVTFGKINTLPGSINVIPGETAFTVDIRHPSEEGLKDTIDQLRKVIIEETAGGVLSYSIEEIKTHPPVHFSGELLELIEEECKSLGFHYERMMSGAGHDAMYVSKVTPTAMIFVPSVGGKSHSPEEETSWSDIEKGTLLLRQTLLRRANAYQYAN